MRHKFAKIMNIAARARKKKSMKNSETATVKTIVFSVSTSTHRRCVYDYVHIFTVRLTHYLCVTCPDHIYAMILIIDLCRLKCFWKFQNP